MIFIIFRQRLQSSMTFLPKFFHSLTSVLPDLWRLISAFLAQVYVSMSTLCQYNKIFNLVIIPNAINMMNFFFRLKISAKMLFYNKTMFQNIVFICGRVFWFIYLNISHIINKSTTFP